MTCVELQESLADIEDGASREQQVHLKSCPACSALVAELALIIATAPGLAEANEPSPRVWNSIEIALRDEGLIRPQRAPQSRVPSFSARWGPARWLVPAAACLLLLIGVYVRQHSISVSEPVGRQTPLNAEPEPEFAGLNDKDLLQEVSDQVPMMRAQYEDNLRRVNEYIQDAKSNLEANPNDEEARRSVMEAYQQKAMLFEMAMDRPLP
jgi:hypothetical protein